MRDRRKIASSLLVESTLLGLMGGAAGLALAATTLPVLLSIAAQELPSMLEITIDPDGARVHARDLARLGAAVRIDPGREVREAASRGDAERQPDGRTA